MKSKSESKQYYDSESVIVGLITGLTFGFIDNLNIYIGLHSLEKYFSSQPPILRAGLAGTLSSAISIYVSGSISAILRDQLGFHGSVSVNAQVIGTILGCLLGIYLPYYIAGK